MCQKNIFSGLNSSHLTDAYQGLATEILSKDPNFKLCDFGLKCSKGVHCIQSYIVYIVHCTQSLFLGS